jgi:ribosomal protein S18 acetylase RimI-like enzyme
MSYGSHSPYEIRPARAEELPQLARIEQSAATRFLDTPYAFLAHGEPLPLEVVQKKWFQAGQAWVVVERTATAAESLVGYAITRDLEGALYLQEIDVLPEHGQQGLGSALLDTIVAWARRQGYGVMLLSTFRDIPWNAPFYAKRGFQILDQFELTAGLRQIRQQESQAGLPIAERVIMRRQL